MAIAIGAKIGPNSTIDDMVSRNIPIIRRAILIISMIMALELVMDSIQSVIMVGTRFMVSIRPKVFAAPNSIMMVADVIVASNMAWQKAFQLR